MKVLEIIWKVLNLAVDAFALWALCCILYGFKWQVGNFMSVKMPGILRRSKRAYKEESRMKVKDRFNLASKTDDVFIAEIVNINNFREPSHKYLLDIYKNGEYLAKAFCSEEFFAQDGVDKEEAE